MLDYYCYVYYDADWVAYYVGKGSLKRAFKRQDKINVPSDKSYIQLFYFQYEWEAHECERDLISFYGRSQDGGSLQNVCLGGEGAPGRAMSKAHYKAIMSSREVPVSLTHTQTGEVREFKSISEASRQLKIPRTSLCSLRLKSRTASKTSHNWRLSNE